MSASEAVVKAVREAEGRHYSVAVKWEVCSSRDLATDDDWIDWTERPR